LAKKGRAVVTVCSDRSVDEAISLMDRERVSALIVTEEDRPVGLFAERDALRTYLKDKTRRFADVKLAHAMTNKLITATPDDRIGAAMKMMLSADIRHLPVVENDRMVGMLTVKDLIEHQMDLLDEELFHLKEYIRDLHDANLD
jgi:CBS domain-containing protein